MPAAAAALGSESSIANQFLQLVAVAVAAAAVPAGACTFWPCLWPGYFYVGCSAALQPALQLYTVKKIGHSNHFFYLLSLPWLKQHGTSAILQVQVQRDFIHNPRFASLCVLHCWWLFAGFA